MSPQTKLLIVSKFLTSMSDHLVFYFSPNYWILSYSYPWPIILRDFLSFIFPTIPNDHTVLSSAPACYWLFLYCIWSPCTWHESPTYDYYFEIRCFQQFSDYAFRLLFKPFQVSCRSESSKYKLGRIRQTCHRPECSGSIEASKPHWSLHYTNY